MVLEFLEPAFKEFNDTIEFYELQYEGLGIRFKKEFDTAINSIIKHPSAWLKESNNTRRFLLKTFPYKIVYLIDDNKIVIIAVANTHRKPFYWIDRIG